MRRLIASEWMTLDGVVQAPIGASEDPDGGFAHGGWHVPHTGTAEFQRSMEALITGAGGFLFGRRTYENFAGYWPHAPEAERAVSEPLNTRPKYVVSSTLAAPLAWRNSEVLAGDVPGAVAALKREPGDPLLVMGSTVLVRTLLEHGLVDELRLMIDPVVAGGGKRIFSEDGVLRQLRLTHSEVTSSGAILATYLPVAG